MIYNINKKEDRFFIDNPVALKVYSKDNCYALYIETCNNNSLKEFYNTFINEDFLYLRTKAKDMFIYESEFFYKKYNNLRDNDVIEYKTKIINPLEKHSINVSDDNYETITSVEIEGYDIYEKMFITDTQSYKNSKVILVQIYDVKYIREHYKLINIFNNIYLKIKNKIKQI